MINSAGSGVAHSAQMVRQHITGRHRLGYKRAHQALNDQDVDIEVLVQSMLAKFIETDKGFQAWRKANPKSA